MSYPAPGVFDVTNDSLASWVHMNLLDGDLLLALTAMTVQRLQQRDVGTR